MLLFRYDKININNDVNDVDGFMCVIVKNFKREKHILIDMCKMKT